MNPPHVFDAQLARVDAGLPEPGHEPITELLQVAQLGLVLLLAKAVGLPENETPAKGAARERGKSGTGTREEEVEPNPAHLLPAEPGGARADVDAESLRLSGTGDALVLPNDVLDVVRDPVEEEEVATVLEGGDEAAKALAHSGDRVGAVEPDVLGTELKSTAIVERWRHEGGHALVADRPPEGHEGGEGLFAHGELRRDTSRVR